MAENDAPALNDMTLAELRLALAPAVAEAAVVGIRDAVRGTVPVAFVTLRPGAEAAAVRAGVSAAVEQAIGGIARLGQANPACPGERQGASGMKNAAKPHKALARPHSPRATGKLVPAPASSPAAAAPASSPRLHPAWKDDMMAAPQRRSTSCISRSRSALRLTLPAGVFGNSVTKATMRGYSCRLRRMRTNSWMSPARLSLCG